MKNNVYENFFKKNNTAVKALVLINFPFPPEDEPEIIE
jgi:hypothetical protein